MTGTTGTAIILLSGPALPDPARLAARALSLSGLTLKNMLQKDPELLVLSSGGGPTLQVRLITAPYAAAAGMLRGLTSPAAGQAEAAPAHLEISATGLPSAPRRGDALLSRLVCAALLCLEEPAAAMLGHGVMFHRAGIFLRTVQGEQPGALPLGVCVDLTIAQEADTGLVTFLTHGMPRYGREDIYISAPRAMSPAALELAALMVRTLYEAPAGTLPAVQEGPELTRQPSPIDPDATVVRIDLDQEENQ